MLRMIITGSSLVALIAVLIWKQNDPLVKHALLVENKMKSHLYNLPLYESMRKQVNAQQKKESVSRTPSAESHWVWGNELGSQKHWQWSNEPGSRIYWKYGTAFGSEIYFKILESSVNHQKPQLQRDEVLILASICRGTAEDGEPSPYFCE